MTNDKYVAMDVHKANVVIGMRDGGGKMIGRAVVETKAQTLRDYVRGLSGTVHLTLEEGTQAAWLYDLLKPLVAECIVCDQRAQWLAQLSERGVRQRASQLYEQLAQLEQWVAGARLQMLRESRKQKAKKILEQIPTLGEISVAQLIATVDTPFRFRSKRQFWTYCGLAVVRHTSADYQFAQGELRRRAKPGPTRGLNRNYNRRLKRLFKSAALAGSSKGPFKPYYDRLLARGLNPELAQVTLARKIAAVTLTLWKKGASFDREKLVKPE